MVRKLSVFAMTLGLALAATAGSPLAACSGSAAESSAATAPKDYGDKEVKTASSCEKMADGAACNTASKTEKLGGGDAEKKATTEAPKADGAKADAATAEAAPTLYGLGDTVSDFTLTDAETGKDASLSKLAGEKATVIIFWNQACPWCVPTGEGVGNSAEAKIKAFAAANKEKGVSTILIDAGVDKPAEKIAEYAQTIVIPLLINDDSSIAVKFDASYTPHTFILDKDKKLVYRGAFHVKDKDAEGGWRNYAQEAVNDIVAGNAPANAEPKGSGCTIKWAEGAKKKSAKAAG